MNGISRKLFLISRFSASHSSLNILTSYEMFTCQESRRFWTLLSLTSINNKHKIKKKSSSVMEIQGFFGKFTYSVGNRFFSKFFLCCIWNFQLNFHRLWNCFGKLKYNFRCGKHRSKNESCLPNDDCFCYQSNFHRQWNGRIALEIAMKLENNNFCNIDFLRNAISSKFWTEK